MERRWADDGGVVRENVVKKVNDTAFSKPSETHNCLACSVLVRAVSSVFLFPLPEERQNILVRVSVRMFRGFDTIRGVKKSNLFPSDLGYVCGIS